MQEVTDFYRCRDRYITNIHIHTYVHSFLQFQSASLLKKYGTHQYKYDYHITTHYHITKHSIITLTRVVNSTLGTFYNYGILTHIKYNIKIKNH